MKNQQPIPTYSLKQSLHGFIHVNAFESCKDQEPHLGQPHRDENYVLFFQQKGDSRLMIDFNEVNVNGCAVIVILPGQVHHRLSATESIAWSVAIDASWVDDRFRNLFLHGKTQNEAVSVSAKESVIIKNAILLLENMLLNLEQAKYYEFTLRSIADTCVTLFASVFSRSEPIQDQQEQRSGIITRAFRQLLTSNFKAMKAPSQYADVLNISVAYLNEAVKASTGYSVGQWIQQEVILEAKRILFYTEYSVKEIAAILGYEDSTYFIRTFSRVTKMSPLQFRKKYRK